MATIFISEAASGTGASLAICLAQRHHEDVLAELRSGDERLTTPLIRELFDIAGASAA